MKLSTLLGTACAAILFTTTNAQAATLALYPFTGTSLSSTDTNVGSDASDIVLDTGLTDTTRFTANGNPGAALRVNGDEAAASFVASNAANDDFTLEIAPISGAKLVLDTLTFDTAVSVATEDSSVRIQLSGTGTTFTTLGTVSDITSTTFAGESFDLSAANAGLATGLPIYIRFLVTDTATLASVYTAFDNITVTGSVAAVVPEPGTNVLLAAGATGMAVGLGLRRRRTGV